MTHVLFHYISFSDTSRSIGWRQGVGKFFEFSQIFSPKNEVLKCANYLFSINKFTSVPQRIAFRGIMNFAIAKEYF